MRTVQGREKRTVEVAVYTPPTCDFCGFVDEYEDNVFDIRMESGIDTCGHERVTRDICQKCYADIFEKAWDTLYSKLKAADSDELREYHEDI